MTHLSGLNNDLLREVEMLRAARAELVEALELIDDQLHAGMVTDFGWQSLRRALANAKVEAPLTTLQQP